MNIENILFEINESIKNEYFENGKFKGLSQNKKGKFVPNKTVLNLPKKPNVKTEEFEIYAFNGNAYITGVLLVEPYTGKSHLFYLTSFGWRDIYGSIGSFPQLHERFMKSVEIERTLKQEVSWAPIEKLIFSCSMKRSITKEELSFITPYMQRHIQNRNVRKGLISSHKVLMHVINSVKKGFETIITDSCLEDIEQYNVQEDFLLSFMRRGRSLYYYNSLPEEKYKELARCFIDWVVLKIVSKHETIDLISVYDEMFKLVQKKISRDIDNISIVFVPQDHNFITSLKEALKKL